MQHRRGLLVLGLALGSSSVLLYILCTATDYWVMSTTRNEELNIGLWRRCSNATGCEAIGTHDVPGYIRFSRGCMVVACILGGLSSMFVVAVVRKSLGGKLMVALGCIIAITGILVVMAIIGYSINCIGDITDDTLSKHPGHSIIIGCCSVPMSMSGGVLICLSVLLRRRSGYLPLETDYDADPS
ncbi:claudin domain-containing protein 2-like [Ptychodera flava]|uniref:claudin domain-containing protein 2-like n=1 Tax=Ptychodera flava TaxID=63121 RepID=UPI00396A1413